MHTFTHTSTNTHTHRHTHTWTYTHMRTPCTYAYIQAHTVQTNQMALSCYVCWHFVPSSFWWTSSLGPSLSKSWTFLQAPTCEHRLEKKEKQNKKQSVFNYDCITKRAKLTITLRTEKYAFFLFFLFILQWLWSVVRLIKVIKTNKHIQKSSIEVIIIFKRFCLNSSWQPLTQLCQSYLKALRVRACAYIYIQGLNLNG